MVIRFSFDVLSATLTALLAFFCLRPAYFYLTSTSVCEVALFAFLGLIHHIIDAMAGLFVVLLAVVFQLAINRLEAAKLTIDAMAGLFVSLLAVVFQLAINRLEAAKLTIDAMAGLF